MDRITFLVLNKSYMEEGVGRIPFSATQICINDENLIFTLKKYEQTFFPKSLAGNYEGIDPRSLYRQFSHDKELKKTAIISPFQCAEHLNDDWDIRFRMKTLRQRVIFDQFTLYAKSHGATFEKGYDTFPAFTFSKEQFQQGLEKLYTLGR